MHHVNWGLPVALDLFFAGLGAAALMLAVVAQLAGDRKYRAVNMAGAIIAPWPVILGVLLLVLDLGRPERFWEMLIRKGPGLIMHSSLSTMSIGTWLLTVFVIASLVYMVVAIATVPFAWGAIVRSLVGLACLPIALLVTIYTGVLIAATSPPLWNTNVLPFMFVSSALATGAAAVVFLLALLSVLKAKHDDDSAIPVLERVIGGLVAVQIVAMILFVVKGAAAPGMSMIVGMPFGGIWWVVALGLGGVVPLLLGLKGGSKRPITALVVSGFVLLGGLCMRFVILYAGQLA